MELGRELEAQQAAPDLDAALDDDVGDDLLRLIFTACHPVLSPEARVALTLRLLGGLTTEEIARAFLVSEPTIAQRIVRAKRTLAEARVPFELPRGADRAARLSSVLEVVYLVFNEGYSATAGDDWLRPALCEDALRLGRILAGLVPNEPEVHGLVALMEIQASRAGARVGPSGEPILLLDQDRTRWDQLLIRRGLDRTRPRRGPGRRARVLRPPGGNRGLSRTSAHRGRDRLGAPGGALHHTRRAHAFTDRGTEPCGGGRRWRPVRLRVSSSSTRFAPRDALDDYHLLPSVRGDLLVKLGRFAEAREEFERAASLTRNSRERALLLERAAQASQAPHPSRADPRDG